MIEIDNMQASIRNFPHNWSIEEYKINEDIMNHMHAQIEEILKLL
jgi:hypothetical protein